MKNRIKLGSSLIILTLTLVSPNAATAFFQKTTVEGIIGNDIGGVWLAVQHVMPTFRVRVDRADETIAPFKVGPITGDFADLMGEDADGVAITEFYDPAVSRQIGVFPGDIITKVNTVPITDVESWEAVLADVKNWFLITVRRSALKHSKVALVKVSYEASEVEVDGVSSIGDEKIVWQISPATLPFADEVEKARRSNDLFKPTAEQVKALASDWHKLDHPERPTFISGEHRVVSADAYDISLRKDESLTDTLFAVVSQLKSNPLAGSSGRMIGIAGIREITPDKITGSYVESTLASAPFPISVDFNGTITLTRITDYSDADVEYRTAQMVTEDDEDMKDVELAPDIPEVIEPVDLSVPVAQ